MTVLLAIVPCRCSFYTHLPTVVQVNLHAESHLIQQSNMLSKAGRALFRKGNFGIGWKKENMEVIFWFELLRRGVQLFPLNARGPRETGHHGQKLPCAAASLAFHSAGSDYSPTD